MIYEDTENVGGNRNMHEIFFIFIKIGPIQAMSEHTISSNLKMEKYTSQDKSSNN